MFGDSSELAPVATHVWIGTITTIIPATFLVAARFWVRVKTSVGLREDDWMICAALAADWTMAAIRFEELVHLGLGQHAQTLPDKTVEKYQKSFVAVQIMYFVTSVLVKMSILLLYRRIFGISKRFLYVVYAVSALVICYFIICFFLTFFGCQPVSYFWNKRQEGRCFDEVQFFRWNGVSNLLLDAVIWSLPLPMVWSLHLKIRQKFAISGIFMLGGFACIASILRINQFGRSNQSDPTYTTADSGTWSSIEQAIGIMCACLPTLGPLIRRQKPGGPMRYNGHQILPRRVRCWDNPASTLTHERDIEHTLSKVASSPLSSVERDLEMGEAGHRDRGEIARSLQEQATTRTIPLGTQESIMPSSDGAGPQTLSPCPQREPDGSAEV